MRPYRTVAILAALCVGTLGTPPAEAVPIDLTISGQILKDPLAGSIFGYTTASTPFQISFTLDTAGAALFPSGTPVIVATGAAFTMDAFLFNSGSVTNFVANIGDQSFAAADLVSQALGTSAFSYDVLLLGSLSAANTVTGVSFMLNSGLGIITVGSVGCAGLLCSLASTGYAEDDSVGTSGETAGIQVSNTAPAVTVPEPASLALLATALVMLAALARGRPQAR